MKHWTVLIAGITSSIAMAQAPDIRIKGDVTLGLLSQSESSLSLRAISPLARFSTISFSGTTPLGLKFNFSQRLANLAGDPDEEAFDEYYVEDPGSWRVGKQYLPFGSSLYRESAIAARIDSALFFEGLPVALALVDGGKGSQQGVVARFGSRGFGVSAAIGSNFGTNFTSLAPIRPLGSRIGNGAGWGQMIGADWSRRFGKISTRIETIFLRNPDLGQKELSVYDGQLSFDIGHKHSIFAGGSFESTANASWLRFGGVYNTARGITVETMFRTRENAFVDASVMLRFKF